MRFYLGTHHSGWLWNETPPLFVSARRLRTRSVARLTPGVGAWALDSGGFSELTLSGGWTQSPESYVDEVRTWSSRIGGMDFAAPQDWMCEPHMITRTGLSVREHQERTVQNFVRLRELAPELPIIPVLQGWSLADYGVCLDMYASAGVDLCSEPRVGLGSVCRRQATAEIGVLVREMHSHGLALHGFGVKAKGLRSYGHYLASADSMAWSFRARRSEPLPECTTHANCANCIRYALRWHDALLLTLDPELEDAA